MARLTSYNDEIVRDAWAYVADYNEIHDQRFPTVVGLCQVIDRSKSTIYEWAKDKEREFSDILEAIAEIQELKLVGGGISGDFNSTITKLMLTKHGYSDKQENTVIGDENKPVRHTIEFIDGSPPST
ncbi:UNVERIFIED_CONTAM: hypothetical protein GTU68_040713 [Idotea baltica]|nr:hypothetical protein [Idotea baltica]